MTAGARRTPPAVAVLGLLLALASAAFAWRVHDLAPRSTGTVRGDGLYTAERAREVRALMGRLAKGLLACQAEGGWFRTQAQVSGTGYNDDGERTGASALALAALATVRDVTVGRAPVPGLEEGLAKGLAWLRTQQLPGGSFARGEGPSLWVAAEATGGAFLAVLLAGDPADASLLDGAGTALTRLAEQKLPAGRSRSIVGMAAERAVGMDREGFLPKGLDALLDARFDDVVPTGNDYLLWDTTLSEVVTRLLRARGSQGLDPLPGRVAQAILERPPTWRGSNTDVSAWWVQAWLAGRTPGSAAWFEALPGPIAEWVDEDGLLPGGFFTSTLLQTACAVLALDEGLRASPTP